MKNNAVIGIVAAAVVFSAAGFYGGMQYQKKQTATQAFGQGGRFFSRNGGNRGPAGLESGRPVSGEILSQDDKSVTVKLPDGSTKIVILSSSTAINKSAAGSTADLKTGERIAAFGTSNPDGSLTAQTISIGGVMFRGFGQGTPSASPAK